MSDAFKVVELFETEVASYTGAPIVIATDSCTNALGIMFEFLAEKNSGESWTVLMPKHTYIGVPMQAKRAGFNIRFRDESWKGEYRIGPFDLWDSARRFRKDMWYEEGDVNPGPHTKFEEYRYKCVSFHATKILGHTQGGAILTNDAELKQFAREMRFDGRRFDVGSDWQPRVVGRHDYMWPDTAGALFYKLKTLPPYPGDLPNSDYPDLSKMEIFK